MSAERWRHCCAKERGIFHLPVGAKCAACGETQKPGMPPGIRARLASLRDEFVHLTSASAAQAQRWRDLDVNQRRLLLAMVGMDDSEEAARRPWELMRPEQQSELLVELRRMRRLVGRLQWA